MPAPGALGFLPDAPVTALQLFNYAGTKTLVASTYGRGIWSYALVTAPNFTIAVTATPNTAVAGQNVTWTGTLTALNGYDGSVTLTCMAGAPQTCTISPVALTPTGDPLLGTALKKLVAALPEKSRAIVVLRYQEDLDPAEIARVLGIPVGTVKSQLQRALALLREKLSRSLGEIGL